MSRKVYFEFSQGSRIFPNLFVNVELLHLSKDFEVDIVATLIDQETIDVDEDGHLKDELWWTLPISLTPFQSYI